MKLVGAILLAGVLAGLALTAGPAEARRTCPGTVSFAGEQSKVVVLRGVSCRTARRVARIYDRRGTPPRPWRCALAHAPFDRIAGRRVGFSCGRGGRRGDIRRWPHAFVGTFAP